MFNVLYIFKPISASKTKFITGSRPAKKGSKAPSAAALRELLVPQALEDQLHGCRHCAGASQSSSREEKVDAQQQPASTAAG